MAGDQLRVRRFSPVDREYPIFEVIDGDEILFDLSKTDEGVAEIAFHAAVSGRVLRLQEVLAAMSSAQGMLDSDANASRDG